MKIILYLINLKLNPNQDNKRGKEDWKRQNI
jgi:hypothetical protein